MPQSHSQSHARHLDRFNEALRSIDEQVQEVRERFESQRRSFEKDIRKRAERLEDQLRSSLSKRAGQLDEQLRESTWYKRAERIAKDVEGQVEQGRDRIFEAFGIASSAEIERIHKKLNAISKKLNELAKSQSGPSRSKGTPQT